MSNYIPFTHELFGSPFNLINIWSISKTNSFIIVRHGKIMVKGSDRVDKLKKKKTKKCGLINHTVYWASPNSFFVIMEKYKFPA